MSSSSQSAQGAVKPEVSAVERTTRVMRLLLFAFAGGGYLIAHRLEFVPTPDALHRWLAPIAWIVLWLSVFRLFNWACRRYVLDAVSQQWLGAPLPHLFRDVFTALLFLATMALTAQTAFGAALVPLYATSGVLTIILGLALQSIILDLFVGFAIHVDHPFRLGDWIRLENGTEAEIEALTWRTVKMRTAAGEVMYMPNGELGRARFTNLWSGGEPVRYQHNFIIEFDVIPDRAYRVLRAAMTASVGKDGILAEPAPSVIMRDTDQQGTHFLIRWWMHPHRPVSPPVAKSRIITAAVEHLQAAGLAIALPITVSPRDMPHVPVVHDEKDRNDLLRLNRLMAPLGEELVAALDPELSIRLVENGSQLIAAGEKPRQVSMVLEGLLVARVEHPTSGESVEAFRLEPGSYFGAHMLDGGRPSMVTIVAESESVLVDINVQRLFELMDATPALAEEVRASHRERQALISAAARIERVANQDRGESETAIESVMRNLAGRARSIRPSGPRLLVVDDSKLQRHQLAKIAESAGWSICGQAEDGVEAVGMYRDLRPDLVTMDLVMPRKDGIEALEEIRSFHKTARVLMVSAVDQPQKLERALALGAIDFVVKPYDAPALKETFERLKGNKTESNSQLVTSGIPRVLG